MPAWRSRLVVVSVLLIISGLVPQTLGTASATTLMVVETRVGAGADDAEESETGNVSLSSSDLEFTFDPNRGQQTVGIRLESVDVPQGARIDHAYLQFQVDETGSDPTALTIETQAIDDAPVFSGANLDISSRTRASASVTWSPPAWNSVGESGPDQRTPSLVPLVQAIIDRPGWVSGNSLVFVIRGSGKRVAEAFDGQSGGAALLHVEYSVGVSVGPIDQVAAEGSTPVDEGIFRFTRAGPTDQPLAVSYSIGGSATPDGDYVALSGDVTIPAGAQSADVVVSPIDDAWVEGTETVVVNVVDGADYVAGSAASATVTLLDDETPSVSVTANQLIATEGANPANQAELTIIRTGETDRELTIDYVVDGDATPDADYVALPGSVTIPTGEPSAAITISTLDDSATEAAETISVTVIDGAGYVAVPPVSVEITIVDDDQALAIRVAASDDDAEEDPAGSMSLASSDLEMVADQARGDQVVGIRFTPVDVPAGAIVTAAWIQFQVDEMSVDATTLTMRGEAVDDAAAFTLSAFDISSRSRTTAGVTWSPPPWDVTRVAGPDQKTPDLSVVVQEIVDRPGWATGNSLAFIITGSGRRVAESYDGDPSAAPILHIEHSGTGSPVNQAPVVRAGADSVVFPAAVSLEGTVSDDLLPVPPAMMTVEWSQLSGPGTATFADSSAAETTATFSAPGVYELQFTADDGELSSADRVLLAAVDPNQDPADRVRFAAIGDYGAGCCDAAAVASLVTSLAPDFLITTGDNRYINDIDQAVGQFYSAYIGNYQGEFGTGSAINRFFPAVGNHDYSEFGGIDVHLGYFSLPGGAVPSTGTSGNERYYDFIEGPVHFFVINSDFREPDGGSSNSRQAQWLQAQLAASTSPWQIVYLHHAPWSSGSIHGPNPDLQWPFEEWGADAVLAGHDHHYERLLKGGIPYFVVGNGGNGLYPEANPPDPDSQFFYNTDYGSLSVEACADRLSFEFHSVSQGVVDNYALGAATCSSFNGPPVAVDDVVGTVEDSAVTVDVVGNDGDVDGNLVAGSANTGCVGCWGPASGLLVNGGDGSFTYTPNLDFSGSDGFTYEVCDSLGLCDTAVVLITVDALNDPPVAVDDVVGTVEGSAVTVDVVGNDTDVDGDGLVVTNLTSPVDGVVVDHGDGTVTYIPDAGFTGSDSFTYTANDGVADSNPATVSVTVDALNGPPVAVEVRVAAGSDDAEERAAGSVSLTSSDLELVVDGSRGVQMVGLRFVGVDVPAGATVTSVWIQFQVDELDSGATDLVVAGQAADNPSTFVNTSGDVSSRARTVAQVAWSPPAWTTVGEAGADQETPDLAAIVQEIVDRPGWVAGNAMVFVVTGSGERTAESYNGSPVAAPLLHVEYSAEPVPNRAPVAADDVAATLVENPVTIDVLGNDTDPDNNLDPSSVSTTCAVCSEPANGVLVNLGTGSFTYTPDPGFLGGDGFVYEVCDSLGLCDAAVVSITVGVAVQEVAEVRVAAGSDDAEENAAGNVSLTSSDMELVADRNRGDQTVGLRFAGVNLPAGAVITSAWVQFQVDELGSVATHLVVEGRAADNPTTFVRTNGNVSSGARTAARVAWSPPAWATVGEAGPDQQTPDLAAIIQEVVNRDGWAAGNAIVIIITGTGTRTAESYNGDTAGAPLLHIEYTAP